MPFLRQICSVSSIRSYLTRTILSQIAILKTWTAPELFLYAFSFWDGKPPILVYILSTALLLFSTHFFHVHVSSSTCLVGFLLSASTLHITRKRAFTNLPEKRSLTLPPWHAIKYPWNILKPITTPCVLCDQVRPHRPRTKGLTFTIWCIFGPQNEKWVRIWAKHVAELE